MASILPMWKSRWGRESSNAEIIKYSFRKSKCELSMYHHMLNDSFRSKEQHTRLNIYIAFKWFNQTGSRLSLSIQAKIAKYESRRFKKNEKTRWNENRALMVLQLEDVSNSLTSISMDGWFFSVATHSRMVLNRVAHMYGWYIENGLFSVATCPWHLFVRRKKLAFPSFHRRCNWCWFSLAYK